MLWIWVWAGLLIALLWCIGDLHNSLVTHEAKLPFAIYHMLARLHIALFVAIVAWPVLVVLYAKAVWEHWRGGAERAEDETEDNPP